MKVYTSEQDELIIKQVIRRALRGSDKEPKWKALRIALALSLARPDHPSKEYDEVRPKGGEYAWDQVCGKHDTDFTDAYRAILSVYHDVDLFEDEEQQFGIVLQRHIRRGLHEIRTGWRETHDFHEFLYQELLSRTPIQGAINDGLAEKLLQALSELDVIAEIRSQADGPRLQSFNLVLADATQLRSLQRAGEELALILGTGPISFSLPGTPRTVTALIPKPRASWGRVSWADIRDKIPSDSANKLSICLGVDPVANPVVFDLAKATHLLVSGTTNSGKSVALHTILCCLLLQNRSDELSLLLIDPKQVEFSAYKGLAHLSEPPIVDMAIAKKALDNIVGEMSARELQLAELGFKNLAEWKQNRGDAPPYIVICIEELADLIMQFPEAENPLVRLAQKGRSAGIHLILATQRPDSVTLSGLLRTNIPSRIALTVQKSSESKIILDEPGAELLLGQGDALVKIVGEPMQRVQCSFVSSNDIRALVNSVK